MNRLILGFVVIAASLQGGPLTLEFLGHDSNFLPVLGINGPLGQERHHISGKVDEALGAIYFSNDQWQITFVKNGPFEGESWFFLNYGQGEGDYYGGYQTVPKPTSIQEYQWETGWMPPTGFCCASDMGYVSLDLHSLNEYGAVAGSVIFRTVDFYVLPDELSPGDIQLNNYSVPYSVDMGRNPYVVPEPSTFMLAGIAGLVCWLARRRISQPAN